LHAGFWSKSLQDFSDHNSGSDNRRAGLVRRSRVDGVMQNNSQELCAESGVTGSRCAPFFPQLLYQCAGLLYGCDVLAINVLRRERQYSSSSPF
jgi:hypothetical protein